MPLPEASQGSSDSIDLGGTGGSFVDLAETFHLHSNLGANHTIYLDFDGHLTTNTYWNSSFNGGQDILTPAFDLDGDVSSFSDSELERIQAIWLRVVEDFAPFDVDVTTEAPALDELINSGSGDDAWGIRVVIGGSASDWYGSAGGVAYTNSFTWSSDTPTFVFENNMSNGHEKYTAEGISHEVGHTLGLSHDGDSSTTYYQGHGSGETGWAPLMGVGYYENLSQWSQGEYLDANNTQDDLAIITGNNGFGYRIDDYGDTNAQADLLTMSGSVVDLAGIIETNDDVDVFSFTTDGGLVDLAIDGAARGQNLDVMASLYDSVGTLIVSSNPSSYLDASISTSLVAGEYYLHVTGVGYGDPQGIGYSDYGSLGQYFVSGTIVPATYDTVSIQSLDATQLEGDVGATDFSFVLTRSSNTEVATSVNYSVTGSGATAASATDFFGGSLPSGLVSFDGNETSKMITIQIAGDLELESDEEFTVTLWGANNETDIGVATATGVILSDDLPPTPGVTVTPTAGLVTQESGGNANFTVVLDSRPTDTVVISVASSDESEGTVSTSELVFSVNNWEQSQTVVVTGVDDAESDGDQTYQVQLDIVSSNDAGYVDLDLSDVQLTNIDDDPVADVVSILAANANQLEGDSGVTDFLFSVTRTGNTSVETVVDYSVVGNGNNPASAADFAGNELPSGTISFLAGETTKTIVIQVAGDVEFELDEEFLVQLSYSEPLGDASILTQIDNAVATGTILADDAAPVAPGITVTPTSGLTTRETGTTASFTVVLDSKPIDDVIIGLASLDTTEGNLSIEQLVFTSENWDEAQAVVVAGVNDTVRDGNVTYQIQVAAASSADSRYDGLDASDVEVTNQDDEKGKPGRDSSGGDDSGGDGTGGRKGGKKNRSESTFAIDDQAEELKGSSQSKSRMDAYFADVNDSNDGGRRSEKAMAALADVLIRRSPDGSGFQSSFLQTLMDDRFSDDAASDSDDEDSPTINQGLAG